MNDKEIFDLAEKYGEWDDFGRWTFRNDDKLLRFVDAIVRTHTPEDVQKIERKWVGLDGDIPGLGLVTEEFYNGMIFAEDILREKNT
jgi:hypothetical protein